MTDQELRLERLEADRQRFSGQVAIVTGSTAEPSIGRSCALRLGREGASVVINGRNEDRVASAEAALRAEGLDVIGVCLLYTSTLPLVGPIKATYAVVTEGGPAEPSGLPPMSLKEAAPVTR